jgi:hypothetical protein
MLDPASIRFRRLERSDLRLMHAWLNRDFVPRWYSRAFR